MSVTLFDRLRAAVLSLLLIAAFAVPAHAGAFEDAVAKFANDDFSDTAEAIEAVAAVISTAEAVHVASAAALQASHFNAG